MCVYVCACVYVCVCVCVLSIGVWRVARGAWRVACGVWRVAGLTYRPSEWVGSSFDQQLHHFQRRVVTLGHFVQDRFARGQG